MFLGPRHGLTTIVAAAACLFTAVAVETAEGASFWYRHRTPGVVAMDKINLPPIIAGITADLSIEVSDTVNPFAGVTVSDPDADDAHDPLFLTVTIDNPETGSFTALGGFADQGDGRYSLDADPTAASAALKALVFAPTEGRLDPGHSETALLTLQVKDAGQKSATATVAIEIVSPMPEVPAWALWSWGVNNIGQLGLGDRTARDTPTQVDPEGEPWAVVSAGGTHVLAIRPDGTLWAWGNGSNGRLGLGGASSPREPQQVGTDTDWVMVEAGETHSMGIKADGTLWTWGHGGNGKLGHGDTKAQSVPTQVMETDPPSDARWTMVAAGTMHSIGVREDGTLWAWGNNSWGQLGLGDDQDRHIPTQVGTDADWTSVWARDHHSLALKSDGSLWAWGDGRTYGELGIGLKVIRQSPDKVITDANKTWRTVSAGLEHILAIQSDGTLWAWGNFADGRLGVEGGVDRTRPIMVDPASDWVAVSAGANHSLAIRQDGTLWGWGSNASGQLARPPGDLPLSEVPMKIDDGPDWKSISASTSFNMGLR